MGCPAGCADIAHHVRVWVPSDPVDRTDIVTAPDGPMGDAARGDSAVPAGPESSDASGGAAGFGELPDADADDLDGFQTTMSRVFGRLRLALGVVPCAAIITDTPATEPAVIGGGIENLLFGVGF